MSDFYRKASSTQEHFILNNLNSEIEAFINEIIRNHKDAKILDVGCGEQPLKKYFTDHGFYYKGLDFKQNSKNTVDYVTKIDEPAVIDDSFDIIICTEVLEHVFNWKVAFVNMKKLLKVEGVILITCPMFYPLHEEPFDYWRPTPFALRKIANEHGFVVQMEKRIGNGFDLLGTIISSSYFYPSNQKWITIISVKMINRLREFLLQKLMNHKKLNIVMESPYFMSNVFILKKIT